MISFQRFFLPNNKKKVIIAGVSFATTKVRFVTINSRYLSNDGVLRSICEIPATYLDQCFSLVESSVSCKSMENSMQEYDLSMSRAALGVCESEN